jgi:hypothetical protein
MNQPNTVNELYLEVLNHSTLSVKDKKALLNQVRKLRAGQDDRWIYRYVVWILGAVAVLIALYPLFGKPVPEGLLALASAAVGALAAFLTPALAKSAEKSADRSATDQASNGSAVTPKT